MSQTAISTHWIAEIVTRWLRRHLEMGGHDPYGSMEGGSVDEFLDVTVERPVLDQLEVEVGCTLEDRVSSSLTGDDREERHLHAVDEAGSGEHLREEPVGVGSEDDPLLLVVQGKAVVEQLRGLACPSSRPSRRACEP